MTSTAYEALTPEQREKVEELAAQLAAARGLTLEEAREAIVRAATLNLGQVEQ